MVKDYPELRVKLGLIFNSTSPSPDPALSHAPGSEKHVEGGAKQQEEAESLLSDDDVDLLVDDLLGECNLPVVQMFLAALILYFGVR